MKTQNCLLNLFIALTVTAVGCNCPFPSPEKSNGKGATDSTIVLIFKDAPDQKSYRVWSTTQPIIISDQVSVTPRKKGCDTIVIKATEKIVGISHLYRVEESIQFSVIAGDTVYFEYDSTDFPHPRSLTNPNYTALYNLRTTIPEYREKNGYTSFGVQGGGLLSSMIEKSPAQWLAGRKVYVEQLQQKIDSLLKEDEWAKEMARFYKSDLYLEELFLDLKQNKESFKPDNLAFQKYAYEKLKTVADKKRASNSNYRLLLNTVVQPAWYKDKNDRHPECAASFLNLARILESDTLSQDIKNRLLGCALFFATQNAPSDTTIKYKQLYVDLTGDTAVKRQLEEFKNSVQSYNADLSLTGLKGDTVLFTPLMAQYKGKIVYVDYWSSSCIPCRREMPNSHKLRKEYQGKEIVFLYLSFDNKQAPWEAAIKKDSLSSELNYRINNLKGAKMLQELKVNKIPRFMIYDKTGRLVEPNAPRPSSKEIRPMLNKYLSL